MAHNRGNNAIKSQDEHKGGSFKYYARKVNMFNDFISYNSLLLLVLFIPSVIANLVQRGDGLDWIVTCPMCSGLRAFLMIMSLIYLGLVLIMLPYFLLLSNSFILREIFFDLIIIG